MKEDESGQVDTTEVMGKFKAVIEVEVRKDKEQYLADKISLFDDMEKALASLARSRGIVNFKLDLD